MHYIIVSDIFGRTTALEHLSIELAVPCEIFDPYDSQILEFSSEEQAYNYFTTNVGIEQYADKLEQFIGAIDKDVMLIGFSAGGSAIWKMSENAGLQNVASALCFYAGQIRFYKALQPCFSTHLIFPYAEKHFCVAQLIDDLSNTANVIIEQVGYAHGFMNSHSPNYNATGYQKTMTALQQFILSGDTLQHFNID